MNKHIGSAFDDFLEEEKIFIEVSAEAFDRVFSWQLDCEHKENNSKD